MPAGAGEPRVVPPSDQAPTTLLGPGGALDPEAGEVGGGDFRNTDEYDRQRARAGQGASVYGAPAEDAGAAFLRWAASQDLQAEDFDFLRWLAGQPPETRQAIIAAGQVGGSGGGRPAGGGAAPSGGGGAPAAPALTDAQVREEIDLLGWGWLANDPEVGPLLIARVKGIKGEAGGIDLDEFNARLRKTKWWKTHPEAVRQWDAKQASDPATAKAELAGSIAQITNQARTMGLDDSGVIYSVAVRAKRFGLTPEEVQDMLAREVDFNKARFGGAASAIQRVRQLEHDYVIPLSRQTRENHARRVISGELDDAGLQAFFVNHARSLFKNNDDVQDAIDRGLTVRDFATPYVEIAARELGLNPNEIDLMDSKWRRALHSRTPDGKPGAMSLDEWNATVRTDERYGWQFTRNANEELSGDIFDGAA